MENLLDLGLDQTRESAKFPNDNLDPKDALPVELREEKDKVISKERETQENVENTLRKGFKSSTSSVQQPSIVTSFRYQCKEKQTTTPDDRGAE